jgi:hypothetical protein
MNVYYVKPAVMSTEAKRSGDISIFTYQRQFIRSGAKRSREISALTDVSETPRLRSG